jgi:PAS domain S-box-containing protein
VPSDKPAAAQELARLLERVPAVLSYWDSTQRCRFCNQASTLWWGLVPESVIGKHASELLGPLYHLNLPHMERVLRGEPQQFERDIPDPHGGPARFSVVNYTPDIVDGDVRGFFVLVTDVSDVKRAQVALLASEARLQQILETAATGLTRCSRDLRYVSANRVFAEIAGLSVEQIIGRPIAEVMGRDALETTRPHIDRVLRGETVEFETEVPFSAGGRRFIKVVYTPWRELDGTVSGWVASVTDITALVAARKAAQDVAQRLRESDRHKGELLARVRELAESLATVREDERRAVAISLHEGVAQDLYAAQLSLQELERKGHFSATIKEMTRELSQIISQSIEHVRNVTNHLYPTSLVHLSLSKALEQLGRDFGRRSGVRVVVDELEDFPELRVESRVLFFRAAQEALANVARHAEASTVDITLEADTERIAMLVVDDGKGITADDLNKIGSLGLLGIRERFAAAGGGLTVERRVSCGTCLTVFLPSGEIDSDARDGTAG